MGRSMQWMVALLAAVALANCGGGTGSGNSSCRRTIDRYEQCGVWSGGAATCYNQPETAFDICLVSCVDQASCSDVADYVCNGVPNTCIDNCLSTSFVCANGRHIDALDQCDGEKDCCGLGNEATCTDDSDELGCKIPPFHCEEFGHEKIDGSQVCDGSANCANGTDEQHCGASICPVLTSN